MMGIIASVYNERMCRFDHKSARSINGILVHISTSICYDYFTFPINVLSFQCINN